MRREQVTREVLVARVRGMANGAEQYDRRRQLPTGSTPKGRLNLVQVLADPFLIVLVEVLPVRHNLP
jgi:hypothetical protein